MKLGALVVLLGVLAGCQDNVSTPFPPGLEPFDDSDAPGELPEDRIEQLQTRSTNKDMIRVYGRGFVLAPPRALWEASLIPEVMIARCNTSEQTVTFDAEPMHALSFMVHYFVDDIVNVDWDDEWRGDIVIGTAEAPELVMIKHQKVQGSDFIYLSEGSVQLRATDDPGVTEVWFVEHLDAISGSEDDVRGGMQDNYDALVSVAHGGSIPPCP